jgi:myo-inositol-1(or 4)-monophosphatase
MDLAAGKLILEEAGGIITDDKGQNIDEMEIEIGACTNIVAAGNAKLHNQILELLK